MGTMNCRISSSKSHLGDHGSTHGTPAFAAFPVGSFADYHFPCAPPIRQVPSRRSMTSSGPCRTGRSKPLHSFAKTGLTRSVLGRTQRRSALQSALSFTRDCGISWALPANSAAAHTGRPDIWVIPRTAYSCSTRSLRGSVTSTPNNLPKRRTIRGCSAIFLTTSCHGAVRR